MDVGSTNAREIRSAVLDLAGIAQLDTSDEMGQRRYAVTTALDDTLQLLAEPEMWVATDQHVNLLSGDLLVTLTVADDQISVSSFLVGEIVETSCGRRAAPDSDGLDWQTSWAFRSRYRDEAFSISGQVIWRNGNLEPNEAEQFARAVAKRTGWSG